MTNNAEFIARTKFALVSFGE